MENLSVKANLCRLGPRAYRIAVFAVICTAGLLVPFYFSAYSSSYRPNVVFETHNAAPQSYILSLGYDEQLSNALKSFLELGSVARDIGARLVTPFVHSSKLYGIPNFIPSASSDRSESPGTYPLTDIFNIADFTNTCYDSSLVPDSFLQFLSYSTRDIVFVYAVTRRSFLGGSNVASKLHPELADPAIKKDLFSCMKGGTLKYCFCKDLLQPFVSKLQKTLTSISPNNPFHVRTALCFQYYKDVTTAELLHQVQKETGIQKLSFIMAHWNGVACHAYTNCSEGSMRTHIRTETNVLSSCDDKVLGNERYNLMSQFIPHEIHLFVKAFLASQGIEGGMEILGAHIRMERMGRNFSEIQCCVNSFVKVVNSVRKRMDRAGSKLMFISDSGEHGTQTCGGENCANVTNFITDQLRSHKLNPMHFDPARFGAKNSESLVALVEMLALSHSTELVYMGYNSAFQRSILGNAIQKGTTQRVHIICGGVESTDSSKLPIDVVHVYDNCKSVN